MRSIVEASVIVLRRTVAKATVDVVAIDIMMVAIVCCTIIMRTCPCTVAGKTSRISTMPYMYHSRTSPIPRTIITSPAAIPRVIPACITVIPWGIERIVPGVIPATIVAVPPRIMPSPVTAAPIVGADAVIIVEPGVVVTVPTTQATCVFEIVIILLDVLLRKCSVIIDGVGLYTLV